MKTTDEAVLSFIGRVGRSPEALAERFPGFDVTRLVRARLVEVVSSEGGETRAHGYEGPAAGDRYVLTSRGAEALGITR